GDGLLILRFRPYQEVLLPDLPAVRDGPVQDQAGGEQPSPYQEHQREYPGHGLLLLGGPSGRGLLHLILLVVGGGDHKRDQDEERDPDGDAPAAVQCRERGVGRVAGGEWEGVARLLSYVLYVI